MSDISTQSHTGKQASWTSSKLPATWQDIFRKRSLAGSSQLWNVFGSQPATHRQRILRHATTEMRTPRIVMNAWLKLDLHTPLFKLTLPDSWNFSHHSIEKSRSVLILPQCSKLKKLSWMKLNLPSRQTSIRTREWSEVVWKIQFTPYPG